jgi:hypothetical protein
MIVKGRALSVTSAFLALWISSRTLLAIWPDPRAPVQGSVHAPGAERLVITPVPQQRNARIRQAEPPPILNQPEPSMSSALHIMHTARTPSALPFPPKLRVAGLATRAWPNEILIAKRTAPYFEKLQEPPSTLLPTQAVVPALTPRHGQSIRFSSWALFRLGAARQVVLANGQLGGSQIGVRMGLPLTTARQGFGLDLSARAYAPLQAKRGKEAALGLSLNHRGNPSLEFIAERRIGLDQGGRNAFSVMAVSGLSDLVLAKGITLNAYAQAGVIGARARDGFVDASVSVDRPVNASGVRIGVGAWGGIQPRVGRLDIGPQVTFPLPVEGRTIRLSAQWRFRVAGDAAPASGPAIVIGSDF